MSAPKDLSMTFKVIITHDTPNYDKKLLVTQRLEEGSRVNPVVIQPGQTQVFSVWSGMKLEIEEI